MTVKSSGSYYYGLDLIRFISATIVVLFHLTWHTEETETFAHFGWIGVQVFFVLSGFVIANSANNATVVRFVRSRFLRLYPAAMVCAVISFIVLIPQVGFEYTEFIHSFFLFPFGPYLATAYWTLPIELAFYGLIALLMFFSNRITIKSVAPYLTIGSSLYIILYFLYMSTVLDLPMLEFGYGFKNMTLLRHGVFFAIGIYFWLASVGELNRKDIKYLAIALIFAFFEISSRSFEINNKINSAELSILTSMLVPLLVFYGMCLLIFIAVKYDYCNSLCKIMGANTLRTLGLATYPFYLLHEVTGNRVKFILINHYDIDLLAAAFIGAASALFISIVVAKKIEPVVRGIFVNIFDYKKRKTT